MTPRWSNVAQSVWGKTRPDDGAWLPLVAHLEDTRAVAELLWDTWLAPITKRRSAADFGGDVSAARTVFIWAASVHDVAKATPAFAGKAEVVGMGHLLDAMKRAGLSCPFVPRDSYAHHGVMGHVVVHAWLTRTHGLDRKAAESIAVLIGGHHGVPPNSALLVSVDRSMRPRMGSPAWGDRAWQEVRDEILEGMAARTGLDAALAALTTDGLSVQVQADLGAAVTVADWLASDSDRFPYESLDTPGQRRADSLATITLPPPWVPSTPPADKAPGEMLSARFPHLARAPIRPFQEAMIEAALSVGEAPIIVGEAPTGEGKTEGALLAAEILAARFGCGGTMVALPTMATSDGMFRRVLGWLRALPCENDVSVYLAHSKAGLNDDFSGLVRDSQARYAAVYDDDTHQGREVGAPVVDSWLRGRKKGLLADHVVGTIDQVLFSALQSKHLALRHLALSSKVVIVDEVHAADDYMRSYLSKALDWLGAYGTPVVLLSATLPSAQRRELVEAYVRGRRGRDGRRSPVEVPAVSTYPCLTVAATQARAVQVAEAPESTDVAVSVLPDDDAIAVILAGAHDGGCVAVVRNTVARAQETYSHLRAHLGDDVVLVHSRFIGPDRAYLEQRIRDALGPPWEAADRPHRIVVVGTQVLEQSLDVDFDLMVTDIAPIDLVLQRLGRVHRHARPAHQRPASLRIPRLLVTGITLGSDPRVVPKFDRGCTAVYGEYRLLRAAAVLLPHLSGEPIRTPTDVPGLVEAGYAEPAVAPPGWEKRWKRSSAAYADQIGDARRRADTFQIADPRRKWSLVDWLPTPVTAQSDDLERGGKAQVRDSEDSLEVVLVRVGNDGLVRVAPGDHAHADAILPARLERADAHVARAASACTVRLPRALTHPGVIEQVIDELESVRGFEGWRDDPWLGGQLVIPLGDGLTARVVGHNVTYDRQLGLLVERDDKPQEAS